MCTGTPHTLEPGGPHFPVTAYCLSAVRRAHAACLLLPGRPTLPACCPTSRPLTPAFILQGIMSTFLWCPEEHPEEQYSDAREKTQVCDQPLAPSVPFITSSCPLASFSCLVHGVVNGHKHILSQSLHPMRHISSTCLMYTPQEATAIVGHMGKKLRRSGAMPSSDGSTPTYDDLTELLCSYDVPTIEQAMAAVTGSVSDLDLQRMVATARSSVTPPPSKADADEDADVDPGSSWYGSPLRPSMLLQHSSIPTMLQLHEGRSLGGPSSPQPQGCGSPAASSEILTGVSDLQGRPSRSASQLIPGAVASDLQQEQSQSLGQLVPAGGVGSQQTQSRSFRQLVPAGLQQERSRSFSQLMPAVGGAPQERSRAVSQLIPGAGAIGLQQEQSRAVSQRMSGSFRMGVGGGGPRPRPPRPAERGTPGLERGGWGGGAGRGEGCMGGRP